ncbi:transposase, IS4 family protein [Candidatus Magnetomorum sp. HK-1]|nr:transposase, IS4 family protein [Candidatus Magnetomorum sp. HK-1]
MYIKAVVKRNKNSTKKYKYLYLVESIRTSKGPRQRLILNLGALDIPKHQHKDLAKAIESMLCGQNTIQPDDPLIETHAKKAVRSILERQSRHAALEKKSDTGIKKIEPDFKNIDVNSLSSYNVRSIGPEYVCHEIWKELGFKNVLKSENIPDKTIAIIETLIIGRLVAPGSERYTKTWAEERSTIYELIGCQQRMSLNTYYRACDTLYKCKDVLEESLSKTEKQLFSLQERLCFFDLTNTYFEGQASANPKAKRGRSKEKRSDCKLLTLALIIDEEGFAKYSKLYPGNQSESKTLKEMIEAMIKIRPSFSKNQTVIMDAGIATKDNIKFLKKKELKYIVVERGYGEFTEEDLQSMEVIFNDKDKKFKIEVKRKGNETEMRLLCRSTGRIKKDEGIRTRQEEHFEEDIKKLNEGLSKKGRMKNYKKVLEKIGRLRERYPKASKVYGVEVKASEKEINEKTTAKEITWKKKKSEENFDGCYVLKTDHIEMSDKEIWKTYMMLTRIETAFRYLKTSLGMRPVYHQLEQRSDGHVFASVMAYHILHVIEYRLRLNGDHRSWKTIRDILSTHVRLTIAYDYENSGKIINGQIRQCSKPEDNQKIIYHRLRLSDLPMINRQVR